MRYHEKVVMVCMGNMCRSPMAQTVALKLAEDAGLSQQFKMNLPTPTHTILASCPTPRRQQPAPAAITRWAESVPAGLQLQISTVLT